MHGICQVFLRVFVYKYYPKSQQKPEKNHYLDKNLQKSATPRNFKS